MDNVDAYIEKNRDRIVEELFGLLRIPSISAGDNHRADMFKAAEYWKKLLIKAGADSAEVFVTEGNPVTFAEKIINPKLPTVLVYGHMDVMPVDPLDQWKTNPFEPEIIDGKIYARGADDDKGQSFMHLKAFEYMVETGTLPCNVKFLIEGEEEIGSPNLSSFCEMQKALLKSDVILVSDTTFISESIPSMTAGLRGIAYWQIEVTGPNRDLHSGLYGGAVANPINVLCELIAKCTDEKHRITIPGFYDDVVEMSDVERKLLNNFPFNKKDYKLGLGVEKLQGEKGYTTIERTGVRPTFDVCGIWGGYAGEGTKTVLPSKAYAKISCRLVPNQDHHKIGKLLSKYVKKIAPESVKVNVEYLHGGQSYVCPTSHPAYLAAEKAMFESFGVRPVPFRSGGSIPIVSAFEEILGVKTILMGFGLESDAIHSPNENFPLDSFFKGISTIPLFYKYFAGKTEMSK
jgi:acetylornithine deacetylase/succinyl-diaminopimelate desuccinylase-like protein